VLKTDLYVILKQITNPLGNTNVRVPQHMI